MQQELFLRLIKDNKIIGYLRITPEHILYGSEIDKDKQIPVGMMNYGMPYDSFELGVKVIDDYWFAGDTGVDRGGYGDIFVLVFDGLKFKLIFEDANLNINALCVNNLVDCKKTGNIHDIRHP